MSGHIASVVPEGSQWAGQLFVTRIEPADWSLHPVEDPLARPIDIRFSPGDGALYILDFGQFEMRAERGVVAEAASGNLWRLRIQGKPTDGGPLPGPVWDTRHSC